MIYDQVIGTADDAKCYNHMCQNASAMNPYATQPA
jgi:hypothetical protein